MVKLKCHLLPQITEIHAQSSELDRHPNPLLMAGLEDDFDTLHANPDHLIFKNSRIYQHQVLQIHYTTYDVRHAEDILNPNTEHCDIMMLHHSESSKQGPNWFGYTRIIGIYHANIQYIRSGMKDYLAWRMDFLHVRWFERVPQQDLHGLDALRFIRMEDCSSFDFVDLSDVLRGCHLLPVFRYGKLHQEQIAMSHIAWDLDDWTFYYVNRYYDRLRHNFAILLCR